MPQSAWANWLDKPDAPTYRPLIDYTIDVWPLDGGGFTMESGPTAEWYWRVYLGDVRINGGLCSNLYLGRQQAKHAIYVFEWSEFKDQHYWDSETRSWYRRGELPTLE
jgi:hypothetical protein